MRRSSPTSSAQGDSLLPPEAPAPARALFLDLDGTIRFSRNGTFINKPEDVAIYNDVPAKLRLFREQGYLLIGITNQGGIEMGYLDEEELIANVGRTQDLLEDCRLDAIYYCPHVGITNHFRKPNPGMIQQAQKEFNIQLNESLMVGDRHEDQGAAENAGVFFKWAADFFGRSSSKVEKTGQTR